MATTATPLTENKLFRGLSPETIRQVLADSAPVECETDTVIVEEGEPSHFLYLIVEGSVRISKRGRGGAQETLTYLESGDFFGEMAVLDQEPTSARATAARPTRVVRLDRQQLDRLFDADAAAVTRNLMHEVVRRLRATDTHFISEVLEAERLSLVGSMVASIIHDFKNPMSTILGAAEMLGEAGADIDRAQFTAIIHRSVERMLGMTQELLDYCRGTTNLELDTVEVRPLLMEVAGELRSGVAGPDIDVQQNAQPGETVEIDRDRFMRLLQNLGKNAVEAMPGGGTLRLDAERRGNQIVFGVEDDGAGIPQELLPRLFEPFVTHGKKKGTGLGMAIVKCIVDAHGGRIDVESTEGRGTRVEVKLPRRQPAATGPGG